MNTLLSLFYKYLEKKILIKEKKKTEHTYEHFYLKVCFLLHILGKYFCSEFL